MARHLLGDAGPPLVKSRRFVDDDATLRAFAFSEVRRCKSPEPGLLPSPPPEVEEGLSLLYQACIAGPREHGRGRASAWRELVPARPVAAARGYWEAWQEFLPPRYTAPLLAAAALATLCAIAPLAAVALGHRPAAERVLTHVERGPEAPLTERTVIAMSGPEIAIIGCGLAGAVTALELLSQGFNRITIYEQSPTLLDSTSSMIAATINLDTTYRDWLHGTAMFSVLDMMRKGFTSSAQSSDTRWANFLLNTAAKLASDPRSSTLQKRRVFRKAHEQLRRLVERFPQLCTALIGHWCCDVGGAARRHLESSGGVACPPSDDPASSTLGLFQMTGDEKLCTWMAQTAGSGVGGCDDEAHGSRRACEAAGHGWQDIAYSYYNAEQTRERLSGFLQSDTDIRCSIAEHRITGYARSEVLFRILGDLLVQNGVSLGLSCNVLALQPQGGPEARLRVVLDPASGDCRLGAGEFDRVIVAAAAASVPLLAGVDPKLGHHLVGIKGYGLSGDAGSPEVPAGQSGRGLHFMDHGRNFEAAYGRSTEDLRVKVWGGHDVLANDEGVKPPYAFCSPAEETRIFRQGPACASALLDVPTTKRLAGMRPVPSIGNSPLVKRYTGDFQNLFLNTGYGYNGYDLSWLASMCTVQWLIQGRLEDPVCQVACKTGPEE